ncbi:SH3 domain-containing protein [Crocosphaera sp. UHCC 0190]|uniref:SH3 domain-containing protein n=1 Tax=Crocosphaera sp. UHCC 0190 TaxID=3110246 RepID=UPI002B1F350C|nr:SH3 domain-containing protein [Crocosphaera sp. UHCC 0190]
MSILRRYTQLILIGFTLMPISFWGLGINIPTVKAQSINQAVIFDPPSNIRLSPNGNVLCSIKVVTSINIYGSKNEWYITDICGQMGYIHQSQIRFQSNSQGTSESVFCEVINIKTGQLALRFTPNGESRAGLNNGNIVQFLSQQNTWYKVKVIKGPNNQVNGLEGWVNSNYLSCYN